MAVNVNEHTTVLADLFPIPQITSESAVLRTRLQSSLVRNDIIAAKEWNKWSS